MFFLRKELIFIFWNILQKLIQQAILLKLFIFFDAGFVILW